MEINISDIQALWLTLKLALVTTLLLLVFGLPLAWWLSKTPSKLRPAVEALVALPLVLPPTVLGFYLLLLFNPDLLPEILGLERLAFTFTGLVIGSFIYSLPFVILPLKNTFDGIDVRLLNLGLLMGKTHLQNLKQVFWPLCAKGIITSLVLGFAHTIGEFGVVLMIGGNIPGETQVLSVAIFEAVESFDYQRAHILSLILLGISFITLFFIFRQGGSHSLSRSVS